MSVNLEARLLPEPTFAGVTSVDVIPPSWVDAASDEAPMGYWKKPNDGHVILAHYGENGTERKMDRGFIRLGAKYGTYASAAMGELKDPLLGLVRRGGLHEMPADQIKGLGWHRVPDRNAKRSHRTVEQMVERVMQERSMSRDDALLVVMPQLATIDLTDYDCPACPGRHFPTEAAKIGHTSVMHKEAIQSESIGKAVAAASGAQAANGANDGLVTLIAQQGDLIAEMRAELAELKAAKAKPAGKAKPPEGAAAE